MKHKKYLIILIIFFITLLCFAEKSNTNLQEVETAIKAENWEKAIKILKKGIKANPENDELYLKLGTIYYEKELYKPAYKYFKQGIQVNNSNTSLLFYISYTAAALNKNEEAGKYRKEYLKYHPSDQRACANYGWLCFKSHKIQEGIKTLKENINKYGENASIYNSLGTLYSELFDYKNSTLFYKKAIDLAIKNHKKYSAAIYSYNKSIVESQFYHFDKALEDAELALKLQKKDFSYIMIGEFEERRNNFKSAFDTYSMAATIDETPMSNLHISSLLLDCGNFEKAEKIIMSVKEFSNEYWISNYGMSVNNFKADLYDYLAKLYKLKYHYQKTKLAINLKDWFKIQKEKILYREKYKYYEYVHRLYVLKVADEFKNNDTANYENDTYKLYINAYYEQAFEDIAGKDLKYLETAEKIETSFIPKSKGAYLAEKGIILKDLNLLNEGISKLEPEWEKHLLKDLYSKGIKIAKHKSNNLYYSYIEKLFDINPTGFLEYNIKLPVNIKINKKTVSKLSNRKTKKIITSSRFIDDEKSPFSLIINIKNNELELELKKRKTYTLYKQSISIDNINKTNFKIFINKAVKDLFRIRL